jgi:hypothetical protein
MIVYRSLTSLIDAVRDSEYPIYLLIDEYDTSVNQAIKNNNEDLVNHLRNETGILSVFRRLFNTVKLAKSNNTIDRVFITDMTSLDSIFNIYKCSPLGFE